MNKIAFFTLASLCLTSLMPVTVSAEDSSNTEITVYKTPWCGCCQVWVEAVEEAGFTVVTKNLDDLSVVKRQSKISEKLQACHTAVLSGERNYILEGHVPLKAIDKLMSEQPDIRGIATPGMPMGSLGMGYDPKARYDVYSFTGKPGSEPKVFYRAGQ